MTANKKEFCEQRIQNKDGFIKTTDTPVAGLTPEQKVALNRKGNELFNQGEIDRARRIFITTGYSDGLSRVGDVLSREGKELDALKLYLLAHNNRKTAPLLEKLAQLIAVIMKEEV